MCWLNQLIILSLIATITVASAENSDIVFPVDFKEEDIATLKSITFQQALPVTLFEGDKASTHLSVPTGLVQAEIKDGRLASGTEFYTMTSLKYKEIFFCPNSSSKDVSTSSSDDISTPEDISEPGHYKNCLAPTKFEKSQILECEIEPEPVISTKPHFEKCGPDGIGISLVMVYRVCPAEFPHKYVTSNIVLYSLCYHESSKKILFVSYKTSMAKFLSENLLAKEREIKFKTLSTNTNSLINEDYHKVLDDAVKSHYQYEFQKMVYPDNFAFAKKRTAAYHYVNIALQHRTLVGLWNQINANIRTNVMEMYIFPRVIRTGVIDIPADQIPLKDEDGQLYNIWCTIVADLNREPHKGVAILMNNFFTENEQLRNYIDGLCEEEDYCVKNLKDEFVRVEGRVRCCRVTEKISKFFLLGDSIISINQVLKIRDITYTAYSRKTINLMDN